MRKYELVIASDSCNGEEKNFCAWVNYNYPEIEATVENVYRSELKDLDGEVLEEEYELGFNLWNRYCNS